MAAQTFRVTATPRARFVLSVMLFQDVKIKELAATKSLTRARRALGLMEPSFNFSTHKRVGDIWRDHTTRNVFTVTSHDADFVLDALAKIDKASGDILYLADLMEQLDSGKDAEDADTALPFDEAAEAPLWKPSLSPIIDQPVLLLDVLREAYAIQSYGKHAEFMSKALALPKDADDNVVPIGEASAK
jgi:hypothetical protein